MILLSVKTECRHEQRLRLFFEMYFSSYIYFAYISRKALLIIDLHIVVRTVLTPALRRRIYCHNKAE